MYASCNSLAKGTRRSRQTLISFLPDDLASLLTATAFSPLPFLPFPSSLLQHGAAAWNPSASVTASVNPLVRQDSQLHPEAAASGSRGVLHPCGNYRLQQAGGFVSHSGLQRRDMLQVVLSGYGSIVLAAGREASALRMGSFVATVAAGFLQALVGAGEH